MGQLVFEPDKSRPGWRDFERSVAFAFGGTAQESKAIFDVLVPISSTPPITYGISCKMRETLQTVERTRRVTVEVSNSSGKFWDALRDIGIGDYAINPNTAGKILINLVESWHHQASLENGGIVDISKSFYLLLQWHKNLAGTDYFSFRFSYQIPKL
ncbi:MAG: hypothetical protein L6R45_24660 [Anaerolineae bacterium]|nr:hypothetical protein [Anaerolineae bacterium]